MSFAHRKDRSIKDLLLKSEVLENFVEVAYPEAPLSLPQKVLCFIYIND